MGFGAKLLKNLKDFWNFLWNDNSTLSWVLSMVLAFIVIKFIFFPGLSFLMQTSLPLVAVVSGSMEHRDVAPCQTVAFGGICMTYFDANPQICGTTPSQRIDSFDGYWSACGDWYVSNGISKIDFDSFPFMRGFNVGDVMVIYGKAYEDVVVGDVIIFIAQDGTPIIHRVVKRNENGTLQTKGDHNSDSIRSGARSEISITKRQYVGTAIGRVPYVGLVKLYALKAIYFVFGR
jgi:signal peptidase I